MKYFQAFAVLYFVALFLISCSGPSRLSKNSAAQKCQDKIVQQISSKQEQEIATAVAERLLSRSCSTKQNCCEEELSVMLPAEGKEYFVRIGLGDKTYSVRAGDTTYYDFGADGTLDAVVKSGRINHDKDFFTQLGEFTDIQSSVEKALGIYKKPLSQSESR